VVADLIVLIMVRLEAGGGLAIAAAVLEVAVDFLMTVPVLASLDSLV
jgi:hypothetical protein